MGLSKHFKFHLYLHTHIWNHSLVYFNKCSDNKLRSRTLWLWLQPVEILHFSSFRSSDDLQADCQSATAKVFRYQKILQGTSFNILATAVGRSPSVLGTIGADKAERVVKLSGAAWPTQNEKVPTYIIFKFIQINVCIVWISH